MDFLLKLVISPLIWIKAKRQKRELDRLITLHGGIDHIPLADIRNILSSIKPESLKEEIAQTRASIHHLEELISLPANSSTLSKLLDRFENNQLISTRQLVDIATLVKGKGNPDTVYMMMQHHGYLPDNVLYFHGDAIDRWRNRL